MLKKIATNKIPPHILWVCEALDKNNYEAYLVGGCVRDLLLEREPRDWDITTNATPQEIIQIFGEDNTVYENDFGTVGVKIKTLIDQVIETSEIVEVTTYRREGEYEDFRRPKKVEWGKSLSEDLERRDFTVNALAYDPARENLVDLYNGQEDIKNKSLRCVGDPEVRFQEDALRMLRAIRFSAELSFVIEGQTFQAIYKLGENLGKISKERIRDEFSKILMTNQAMSSIIILHKLNILKFISPDLEKSVGVLQNGHHKYDVFEHLLRSLDYAVQKGYDFDTRLAALFHDIGKPATRRFDKSKQDYTFYGHEVVGARITKQNLEALKFEKRIIERVTSLVRYHMFFSDTELITLSAVRRLIVNIGKENIWDLINLRICDRMGSGTKKEEPYRFRKFQAMIEEALRDEVSLKNLKINGGKIIEILNLKPSKKVGLILNALFEEVIDDINKNTQNYLENRVLDLNKLSNEELEALASKGKEKMEDLNKIELEKIKNRFRVK